MIKRPRGRGVLAENARGRGGEGARGRKKKKDENPPASKAKPRMTPAVVGTCRVSKKPHNVFLSELYFFIPFTVHFSRLTDFNK